MSEGLEALEKLTNYKCSRMSEKIECKEIIEKELKDYENLKLKHKSMQDAVLDDFKKLKALEIIKEKRVNVDIFLNRIKRDTDYKEYKRLCGLYKITIFSGKELTQQEYELLKEVLYERKSRNKSK